MMQKAYLQKGLVSNVENAILVKDIDEKEGRIRGYFAVFGNVDSDGDIVMPGAFKRTIQNNGKRIKHLWQHNPEQPLSVPKVEEDSYGLLFDSLISKTSYGRDALQLYLDGVVFEHSIGYEVIRKRDSDTLTVERWGQKVPVSELYELKLWEGSTVTWAANPKALTDSIKGMGKEDALELITKRQNSLLKAIRNGKFENEEIFDMLELYFKQLQGHIIDLTSSTQTAETPAPGPQTKECNNELKTSEILTLIELQKQSLTFN